MTGKTEKIEVRVTKEVKESIKNKAERMGFNSVSAYIVESAQNHFRLTLDMSVYRGIAKEINYIGKNINSLIRKINTLGAYSDNDVDFIKTNQKMIIELMNKEYGRLLDLKMNFTSESLGLKEKENLIKALKKNKIDVPKNVVLEEVYERIKGDFIYIGQAIENSPEQDRDVEEYFWQYLYGDTLVKLDEKRLIEFADKIFLYTQKLKFKLLKIKNVFDDDDWYDLKDILDEYEVY